MFDWGHAGRGAVQVSTATTIAQPDVSSSRWLSYLKARLLSTKTSSRHFETLCQ
jgi:hypothetical protein